MSTIPAPEADELQLDIAHAEAISLVERLRVLDHRRAPGVLPAGNLDLVDLGLVGVTQIDGYKSWWITSYGMRLIGVQLDPPTWQVTWRADGVRRSTNASLTLETTRECVANLVASLRAGDRISRITVLTPAGENVTAEIARGLIPHAEELAALAHRAKVIAGLVELADYLRANPAVPVPAGPVLSNYLNAPTDSAGHDAVYVAANALGVRAQDAGRALVAARSFGPLRYEVVHVDAIDAEPAATALHSSAPVATFAPGAAPIGWTAEADGGARS